MKVALVHDWLTGMRGGERVLEDLCILFPDASLFTLFHEPGSVSRRIESMSIHTSFLDRIPGARRHYRHLLPLFPLAISRFDLRGFDLVLSISHAVAKGVRKPLERPHICYCLTPMRYIWDMRRDYFHYADPLGIKRTALRTLTTPLRRWDCETARAVDHFIADSRHVQGRILKYYGRDAEIIYPPVDTDFFSPSVEERAGSFYLVVSALVPYKRLDIAVEAFNRLGYPLVIAGAGPDLHKLRAKAAGNIQFRGFVTNEELRALYQGCRAVLVTAREDFGLVALEAQACGRAAVAYAAGGALESTTDGETGILFCRQTAASLIEGIRLLEQTRFVPERLRQNALRFSRETFRRTLLEAVRHRCDGGRLHPRRRAVAPGLRANAAGSFDRAHPSLGGITGSAKRGLDVLVSLCGLLVLGLPLLLMAVLIRRQTPGPGFFRQTRVGLHGREFVMLKLRTMTSDAERGKGAIWAVDNDPRCTTVGATLRRYGIDEIPQLWNVLVGDMSLVGPRPERPEFHSVFVETCPDFKRRTQVRGGITGLAQVRGWRGDTPMEQRVQSDLEYIGRWSFWRDLLILFRTPFFLVSQNSQMSRSVPPVAEIREHALDIP